MCGRPAGKADDPRTESLLPRLPDGEEAEAGIGRIAAACPGQAGEADE